MLNNNEKKILNSIKFFPIIIIVLFSIVFTYTFISQNKKVFQSDVKRIETDFMHQHKELIKKDVEVLTSTSHLTLTSSFMKRKLSLL